MLKGVSPSFYEFPEHQFSGLNPTHYDHHISEAVYSTDEFRMYGFKIKRCTKTRSHDWTECPYAHRGEKAQRRDPRKFNYAAVACPAFRNGKCEKGDTCEFAHGVFEYWLHPARYRTRACNAGRYCERKVCFFAHTPEQLRSDTKHKCHYAYRVRRSNSDDDVVGNGSGGLERATSAPAPEVEDDDDGHCPSDGFSDFLKSLRDLKIRDGAGEVGRNFGWDVSVQNFDLPDIDWISELVD